MSPKNNELTAEAREDAFDPSRMQMSLEGLEELDGVGKGLLNFDKLDLGRLSDEEH